jgi:hypothetical protein
MKTGYSVDLSLTEYTFYTLQEMVHLRVPGWCEAENTIMEITIFNFDTQGNHHQLELKKDQIHNLLSQFSIRDDYHSLGIRLLQDSQVSFTLSSLP